jgi:hypothetical protein
VSKAPRQRTNQRPLPQDQHLEHDRTRFRAGYISLGAPAVLVGVGYSLATAGGPYFWSGVIVANSAFAWVLADWWIFSRASSSSKRLLLAALVSVFFAGGFDWMAFRPAPLGVFLIAEDRNYPTGTEIFGIKWENGLSELRMLVTDESGGDYSNLQILVRSDLMIRAAGSDSSSCLYGSWLPTQLGAETLTSEETSTPIVHSFATVYKISCDKLAAHGKLEVVLAVLKGGSNRPKPSWATGRATYRIAGSTRTKEFSQCFVSSCPDMVSVPK